jgi:hypothetical protein
LEVIVNKRSKRRPLHTVPISSDALRDYVTLLLQSSPKIRESYAKHHADWGRYDQDGNEIQTEVPNGPSFMDAIHRPKTCLSLIVKQPSSINEALASVCLREMESAHSTVRFVDDQTLVVIAECVKLVRPVRRHKKAKELVEHQFSLIAEPHFSKGVPARIIKSFCEATADLPLHEQVLILDATLEAVRFGLSGYIESIRRAHVWCSAAKISPILIDILEQHPEVANLDANIVYRLSRTPMSQPRTMIKLLNRITSEDAAVYAIGMMDYAWREKFFHAYKRLYTDIESTRVRDRVLGILSSYLNFSTLANEQRVVYLNAMTSLDAKRRAIGSAVYDADSVVDIECLKMAIDQLSVSESDRVYLLAGLSYAVSHCYGTVKDIESYLAEPTEDKTLLN